MTDQEKAQHEARLRWIVENEILLLDGPEGALPGQRSYDDMIIDYLNQATQPITVVVKLGGELSTTQAAPKRAAGFKYLTHRNLDQVCLVGLRLNPIARFAAEIVKKVVGIKVKNFDSLQEAMNYLEYQKQNKPL